MHKYPTECPVVIVGAGPAGLTTANLLGRYGVDCVVLERENQPMNLPRAIVLDDEGARTLQVFGLDKTYVSSAEPGDGSKYFDDDGNCFAETGKGPQNFGFPKRQFIFQPELEEALLSRLEEQTPGILHFSSDVVGVENKSDHALVSVQDAQGKQHVIKTQWVLACDGGRSPTRERLGIAMSGNTYEEDWIVVDTLNDPDQSRHSKFYCSGVRPTVSVPAPNGGRRYEFMLLAGETREQVLEASFLATLLKPFRKYDPSETLRKTVYTFHARIAERFREGRILLLGDAAHLTPPFAGQGMNAGLRDTHNVAWKIAAVVQGGAHPDILDSYELERREPVWDMIQIAVAMGSIVMPVSKEQVTFRNLLIRSLEPFPKVRNYLIEMRFKPKPRYLDGLFQNLSDPIFESSLVGDMIPQPAVDNAGQRILLDGVLGDGFALIAQSTAAGEVLSQLDQTGFLGLPLTKVHLNTLGTKHKTGVTPLDDVTTRPFLTHRDQILLVRPDRYCAAAYFPDTLEIGLRAYQEQLVRSNTATASA
mgnify:CR=1 FL=1|tara:strand:+ start:3745 stop:5346 length:1602 start_codon:yes stop_codon:yes gene_type:complete